MHAVLVAVELALESGRPSAEHVLNVLARLKENGHAVETVIAAPRLKVEPKANVQRYDALRHDQENPDE